MANSKNPHQARWFGTGDTTEKTLRRRSTSWRRLRRRCTIAQVARQYNAKKKVDGDEAATNQGFPQTASNTYIYSEKLSHQEKVGLTQTNSPGEGMSNLRDQSHSDWGVITSTVTVVGCPSVRLSIARMGATYPTKRPIPSNYYQECCHKNIADSQLIRPTCLSHIHVLYSQYRQLINIKYQPNSSRIFFRLILNLYTIHLQWCMGWPLNNCKFSQWARAP